MKIMFLIPSLEPGGAERQLVQLANGLAERGHDIGVALFRKTGALLDDLSPKVTLHDLKKGGKGDLFGFLWRTGRLLRQENVDVLYSFLGVPNLVSAVLQPWLTGVKAVWSVRASDMDLNEYSLLSRLCWRAECLLSGVADLIIANSRTGSTYVVGQGFPEKVVRVVPNGIDTRHFSPEQNQDDKLRAVFGSEPKTILVGLVARLDPMKDHRTFLHAIQDAAGKDESLRFVCVGDGPMAEELKQLSAALNLEDKLVWAGTQRNMPSVYNALDVCCLTSVSEGFPNVLAEAMSCGVPCVASDVGDIAEIIGDTGLVVPKRDVKAFSRAMREMAERVRSGKVSDSRTRIEQNFSLDRAVERTESLLSGVEE